MDEIDQQIQSILEGINILMQRQAIDPSFLEQLQEIDKAVWDLVEETA